MHAWGYVILIVGAIVIGLGAQYLMRQRVGYEWVLTSVGAAVGGFVASEYHLGGLGKWGTEVAAMSIFPALIGAVILAVIVEAVIYFTVRPRTHA